MRPALSTILFGVSISLLKVVVAAPQSISMMVMSR
jgi:hypothetical protein